MSKLMLDIDSLLPLGEKKKLLNQFITNAKESEVDAILKNCKSLPSSQYNLLKCLLADKFHRFDLIIELIYHGDSSNIGAVSKRWIYEKDDSPLVDSEFLLNKLFPNVSYNCRQKVLNRLGLYLHNEDKADKIWNSVEERYGFYVALPILQACSKVKINSVIANKKIDLCGYQLVQVLEKYPDIGLAYLRNHDTCVSGSPTNSYRSPLQFLYRNHLDDFVDLCINHPNKICFKLGRKRSTNIIRAYRAKLLEHSSQFASLLKVDRIKREFSSEEFQTFFESSLPKEPGTVNDNIWRWVNFAPKNMRVKMVNEAFMKLYQINLDEHPEYMSPEYITLLPDERRMSVVQWKISNDNLSYWTFKNVYVYYYNDDDKKRAWLPLKPTNHSVPELQKMLLIEQDVSIRATLSKYLIETCYINEDLPHLLNVLTVLNKRSRNDQGEVRNQIFGALRNIMEKMEFTKKHWDIIIEMIQVALVFKDSRDYSDGDKEKMVEKCIAFHLASKLPLNNLVSMHIKLKIQISTSCWTNSHIKNAADRRILLELYVKELENLQLANNLRSYNGISMEDEKLTEFIANLIEEICNFNKTETKTSESLKPISISSHKWLRNSLEEIVKKEGERINKHFHNPVSVYSLHFANQLINIIRALRKEQNLFVDKLNESVDLLLKILHCYPQNSILMHYLNTKPSEILQNWSTALLKMLQVESSAEFMSKLKSWNYSSIIAQTIKICSEIMDQTIEKESGFTVEQKCNAVRVLSILGESSEFLALAAKFYPPETKVDIFAEDSEQDYRIRQTIAKSIMYVTESHLTFPAIEKFCVGDYLKVTVGAMCSQTGRASELEALNFLHPKLVNTPVSLQKHIIRQYFLISSVEDKRRVLNEIESSNVSIRREIFLQASKLFRSSPSLGTWNILKTVIEKATVDDGPIVQYLHSTPKLDTCPIEYISKYIQTCLALLRKIEPSKIENFMNNVESIIEKIPEDTLDDIILHNDADQASFTFSSTFCVKYLQSSLTSSILEHRLLKMWSLLLNNIRYGWDRKTLRQYEINSYEYPTRSLVFSFISSLCLQEMNDPTKAWIKNQIFETLLDKFKTESVTKFFKEVLYIELALLLIKEVGNNGIERLRSFGQRLAQFSDSLVEIYGGEIIGIVKDTFNEYVQACFSDEFSKYVGVIVELIDGILETSKTRHNQIISVTFLQNANPKTGNLLATLDKVNGILKESNDVVAQIYYSFARN